MSRRALIVDRRTTIRLELVEAFRRADFLAGACAEIAEALAVLNGNEVDVVVLGLIGAERDRRMLVDQIRSEIRRELPILLLSPEAPDAEYLAELDARTRVHVGPPDQTQPVVADACELLKLPVPVAAPEILVIDDSRTYREALRIVLVAAGYTVRTAQDGEEGLRLAAERRPAGIIVDGIMPGIDGATCIRRIRLDAALRGTPCVLLTGAEDRSAELQALDAGADAFMRKEEDLEVVIARLSAALRRAVSERSEGVSLLGPKRLLAVDDRPDQLGALARGLRKLGYEVLEATSGEAALDVLATQAIDGLLLAYDLDGLSGVETCRRIKTAPLFREVPLMMLLANEDRQLMIEVLGAGADDCLTRNSSDENLDARLRALLRRKQFEDESRRIREALLTRELEAAEARAARVVAEAKAALSEELERKNKELEAFSYSVSHDLRAPLRSISGFSQALLEDFGGQLDPKACDYLNRVVSAAHRMSELIEDLLNLSRISRADLHKAKVDLSELARAVGRDLAAKDPTRVVRLIVTEDLSAEADRRLMRVVFENLLGNSWKFTGRSTDPTVWFSAELKAEEAIFSVRDNGAGFNMTHATKLFQPFQRLHREAEFSGTGIGLATVQRIIDRHGGRTWAESAVGQGTTVYFTLPHQGGRR